MLLGMAMLTLSLIKSMMPLGSLCAFIFVLLDEFIKDADSPLLGEDSKLLLELNWLLLWSCLKD